MSDEIEHEDGILGTALSRAVESQPVRETPFEGSRLAERLVHPRRSFAVPALAAAAAVVLGLTLGGALLAGRGSQPGPVATEPMPTLAPTPQVAFLTPAPTPVAPSVLRPTIYAAREDLPPVGVQIGDLSGTRVAQDRIGARLTMLRAWRPRDVPIGSTNLLWNNSFQGGVRVNIEGDLAKIDLLIEQPWTVTKPSDDLGILQQLVYTATEERGIRRVLFTANGQPLSIGTRLVDRALSREDVFGYSQAGRIGTVRGFGSRQAQQRTATTALSVDEVVPGLARFVVTLDQRGIGPSDPYPDWDVTLVRNDESLRPDFGKWRLVVRVYGVLDRTTVARRLDQSPVRVIEETSLAGPQSPTPDAPIIYQIGLDDARPWRTAMLFDPVRILVDIGGPPQTIAANTAVYGPRPGQTVSRMFAISGVASAFEAHVSWRVRDGSGRIVSSFGTTATNCCEPGGVFETIAGVPESVVGRATLEVFQASGRDGGPVELIAIPLEIRPTGGIAAAPRPAQPLFSPTRGPYRTQAEAIRAATYLVRGPIDRQEAQFTSFARLAKEHGVRTYQIDPDREIYVVFVGAPIEAPHPCRSFVKVIDASDGIDRGTLCGDGPWPGFR